MTVCAVDAIAASPKGTPSDAVPFSPPVANPFEARIGSMVQIDDEALRLDIGASFDLFEPIPNIEYTDSVTQQAQQSDWLRIGIDFMTWTRLRSIGNFKFPVETIDYWFGVHAAYRFASSPLHVRMRVAHISSHMADGLADTLGTIAPTPFVYSREFVEVLFGYTLGDDGGNMRPYIGGTIVWTNQPAAPDPLIPQAGVDFDFPLGSRNNSFEYDYHIQFGYDVKLIGIDGVYAAANAAQLGLKVDTWNNTGIFTGVYGYTGRSMHGMFYTEFDTYIGVGIQFMW